MVRRSRRVSRRRSGRVSRRRSGRVSRRRSKVSRRKQRKSKLQRGGSDIPKDLSFLQPRDTREIMPKIASLESALLELQRKDPTPSDYSNVVDICNALISKANTTVKKDQVRGTAYTSFISAVTKIKDDHQSQHDVASANLGSLGGDFTLPNLSL
jgi:hypothetical protein